MSRLSIIDPAASTGEVKSLLDGVNKALGVTPNLFRVAANSPAALNAMVQMSGALARGVLSAKTRESIALAVAESNGCDYCLSAHTVLGKHAGLTESEIDSARQGTARDGKLNAILRFTKAVVASRGDIPDSEIASAKAAGVTEPEIAEIVANVALNVYTNYLNNVTQTEIDFPVVHAGTLV